MQNPTLKKERKTTRNQVIAWSLQGFLILVACVSVWFYVTRDYNQYDEQRYHALSGALSQVGVAYWERDTVTGEYRFGDNFASFLGITEREMPISWIDAIMDFVSRINPGSITVDDWLAAVHPEDRGELARLLEIGEGTFSGSFRIVNHSNGWRQVLVSGVVHGHLMVGVCAAFPEVPVRLEQKKQ